MSDGISGYGTTLTGDSFGVVGEVTSLSIGGMSANSIDISTLTSPNKWREFIAGMKDAGEITLDVFYEETQFGTLRNSLGGDNEDWQIDFPDGFWFKCAGHISNVGAEIPMDDGITNSITIKLSGEPTTSEGT